MNTQILNPVNTTVLAVADFTGDHIPEAEFTSIPRLPNTKRDRKENRTFGPQFFTPGTVCEIQVSRHRNPEPKVITVKDMVKNGPDSYVIRTGQMNPDLPDCEEGYNISHVTRIIKHATGVVKFDKEEYNVYTGFVDQLECYEFLGTIKHPSQYRTHSLSSLTMCILPKVLNEDQLVDLEELVRMLRNQNVFQIILTNSEWRPKIYVINKKKFKKVLKRLVPKCLKNHFKAQKEHDDMMYRDMSDDFGDETW